MIVWLKTYAGDHAHGFVVFATPRVKVTQMRLTAPVACLCGERVVPEGAVFVGPDHKRCPTCERKARKLELEQAHGQEIMKVLIEAVTGKKSKRIGMSMKKSEGR